MVIHQNQMNNDQVSGYCVFESVVKTASDLSSIIWTVIIIYSSYATVVHGSTLIRLELFFLSVGFLLPILLAIVYATFYPDPFSLTITSTASTLTSAGSTLRPQASSSA
jgi:hypothetical protein